jgi:hypothetical protein
MVHVHGRQVERLAAQTRELPAAQLVAVPIDVGKTTAMALACDFSGQLLVRGFEFPLTLSGVAELVRRVEHVGVQRSVRLIRVGIEAAGHYHQPLVSTGCCRPPGRSSSSTPPTSLRNDVLGASAGSRPTGLTSSRSATC